MLRAIAIAIIAATLPAAANADAGGSAGARISAVVPEVCDIEASNFSAHPDSGLITGQIVEACNHGRGFQILASHRPLDEQERVAVGYGDDLARLDRSGFSLISFRSGARYGAVPVTISANNLLQTLHVSFSLTAV